MILKGLEDTIADKSRLAYSDRSGQDNSAKGIRGDQHQQGSASGGDIISMEDVAGAFFMMLIGYGLCVVVLVGENIVTSCHGFERKPKVVELQSAVSSNQFALNLVPSMRDSVQAQMSAISVQEITQ